MKRLAICVLVLGSVLVGCDDLSGKSQPGLTVTEEQAVQDLRVSVNIYGISSRWSKLLDLGYCNTGEFYTRVLEHIDDEAFSQWFYEQLQEGSLPWNAYGWGPKDKEVVTWAFSSGVSYRRRSGFNVTFDDLREHGFRANLPEVFVAVLLEDMHADEAALLDKQIAAVRGQIDRNMNVRRMGDDAIRVGSEETGRLRQELNNLEIERATLGDDLKVLWHRTR